MATRQLIDYLPDVIKDVREYKAINITAEQPEFDNAWLIVDAGLDNQFVLSANAFGLSRFEKILKIQSEASDALEVRRFRILSYLNQSLPYTMRRLEGLLDALCGHDSYLIKLNNNAYRLTVAIDYSRHQVIETAKALLSRIAPANLILEVNIKYNTHGELRRFMHAQLTSRTHKQIREDDLD